MFEAIVIGVAVAFFNVAFTDAVGPHQEPAQKERVAVLSEKTGEVLYYNYKH